MPKIQKTKTTVSNKNGVKEYNKHFVVIPKLIMDILGWNAGDELRFCIDKEDVISGTAKIQRKCSGVTN